MADDYYKTLGVKRDASQADIQKAYRELARKHHPDLNPNDKTAKKKFQELQAAFDVLNDPGKRELYDRYGSSFESMGAGGPSPGAGARRARQTGPDGDFDFSQFFDERFAGDPSGGFADIFSQFRGAGAQPRGRGKRSQRGEDMRHQIEVPFQTAVEGGQVELQLQRGDAEVETLSVKIPAGIDDGKTIRLRGQGQPVARGTPGDLLITVHVLSHAYFQRVANNLHVKAPVTLAEAAFGAKIDVPTPHGTVTVQVPKRTSSGKRLRVKGYGVRPAAGEAGDLLVEVQIELPKELDEDSLAAIREIDRKFPLDPRRNLQW